MHGVTRRGLTLGLPILPGAPAARAQAPAWPDRPVRLLVPAPPGSAPDLVAREVAEPLARRFGQPFPVENRPGADGLLAIEAMLAARPGEALLVSFTSALTVSPLLRSPPPPYEPLEALLPLAALAADAFGLFAAKDLPGEGLPGLVAEARAAGPARLNWYASPGAPFLAMRAFLREAGLAEMAYVAYRGAPAALADLAAGRLQAALVPLATALPLAREGRARLVATTGRGRAAAVPEVPTAAEAGFPALWQEGMLGLFGWRGMPPALAEALAREAGGAMAAIGGRLAARGQAARPERLQDFAALLAADRARLGALAREFPLPPA
ncbi:tripartite tricarboxylate transporter substrate-binding protein [Roseicella aerolata]|uniref:Tripartite tricarboxylate transporter substrate binding protein n=1 Tax=Roseicella aerolata TaxID=2883479 RepID=A0A9X1IDF7_9PROT|nr:tripartite tricarboxylate transporter substrate-binding protein [Roseicella aerolata]MCB4822377.1 hypothetical protein [Roseicella aerolata]